MKDEKIKQRSVKQAENPSNFANNLEQSSFWLNFWKNRSRLKNIQTQNSRMYFLGTLEEILPKRQFLCKKFGRFNPLCNNIVSKSLPQEIAGDFWEHFHGMLFFFLQKVLERQCLKITQRFYQLFYSKKELEILLKRKFDTFSELFQLFRQSISLRLSIITINKCK